MAAISDAHGGNAAACLPGTRALHSRVLRSTRTWLPHTAIRLAAYGRIAGSCVGATALRPPRRTPPQPSRPHGARPHTRMHNVQPAPPRTGAPRPAGRLAAMTTDLHALLGDDADALLGYTAKAFPTENLTLPGTELPRPTSSPTATAPRRAAQPRAVFNHGRLGGTGYLSILPVDQGIEHSAAASFSKNPAYFDPLNLLELALAGECNAVATTLGTLGLAARKYVHRIPFIVQAQPQRVPARARHLRPDHVRLRPARPSTSARSASAPPSTSARTTWTASSSR